MSGNNGRKFTIHRQPSRTQPREDFAAVFAGTFSDQPAIPVDIAIDAIEPSPYQARQEFVDLEELAESIRTHGFTSRLRVRPHPTQHDRYQLVYGERRLRAAKLAGLQTIPCDVAHHSDADLREIGLIENLQRQDLAVLEEARAFRLMLDENGYSMRTLAERIGKSKGYIQNKLDLLRAPADVQDLVNAHADTQSAGLIIAQLPSVEQRKQLIQGVASGALDTKMVRDMVNALKGASVPQAHGHEYGTTVEREPAQGSHQTSKNNPLAPLVQSSVVRAERTDADTHRQARHSQRALTQAIQTLKTMTAQLQGTLDQLQSADRTLLLNFVLFEHFPEIERLVEELRS